MKSCSACHREKPDVSNRALKNNSALLCGSCYGKTLPICYSCGYRRKPISFTFDKKPICTICTIEVTRNCKYCNMMIPAGTGHYCSQCINTKTLNNRVKFGRGFLSPHFSDLFSHFGDWLSARRGVQFAATHIQNYFPFFIELDKFSSDCGRIPSYQEIINQFAVVMTRKNLLVTIFLDESGIISVEESIKTNYSNLDSIERYLEIFEPTGTLSKYLTCYFSRLSVKFYAGKTSIRSVRLALTPAVKLLRSCEKFSLESPTNELLYALLWVSPGQRASITGFINHLNSSYQLGLILPKKKDLVIHKHRLSKAQLKQRLIGFLRKPKISKSFKEEMIHASLAYFHQVSIPKLVCASSLRLQKDSGVLDDN